MWIICHFIWGCSWPQDWILSYSYIRVLCCNLHIVIMVKVKVVPLLNELSTRLRSYMEGSRCMHTCFLDLGNGWRWVVCFIPQERAPSTHCIGGWVGPRTSLDDMEKWKFLTIMGLVLRSPGHPGRSQSRYWLRYRGSRSHNSRAKYGHKCSVLTCSFTEFQMDICRFLSSVSRLVQI
jgi:hypothetical protein